MTASIQFASTKTSLDDKNRDRSNNALLCADEVASRLKVCKATVYKMVKEGQIEAVHLGRLVRFTPEAFEAFVAGHGA